MEIHRIKNKNYKFCAADDGTASRLPEGTSYYNGAPVGQQSSADIEKLARNSSFAQQENVSNAGIVAGETGSAIGSGAKELADEIAKNAPENATQTNNGSGYVPQGDLNREYNDSKEENDGMTGDLATDDTAANVPTGGAGTGESDASGEDDYVEMNLDDVKDVIELLASIRRKINRISQAFTGDEYSGRNGQGPNGTHTFDTEYDLPFKLSELEHENEFLYSDNLAENIRIINSAIDGSLSQLKADVIAYRKWLEKNVEITERTKQEINGIADQQ